MLIAQRLWRFLLRYHLETSWLVTATLVHYLLFWGVLALSEPADTKLTEAVNYWYYWWVTCLTIGYGDLAPVSDYGRFAFPFFAASGIALITAWIGKIAQHIWKITTAKRRGTVDISHKGHTLVIGSFHHQRIPQLVKEIIADKSDDGGDIPPIVGCFDNTGDENPFLKPDKQLLGVQLGYFQVGKKGFDLETLERMNAGEAAEIYLVCEQDTVALGIICALSRLGTSARIVVLFREQSSSELVPNVPLDVRVSIPTQVSLAVREMHDGAGTALETLAQCTKEGTIYTYKLPGTLGACKFQDIRAQMLRQLGETVIPIGFQSRTGGKLFQHLCPGDDDVVGAENEVLYIARRDIRSEEATQLDVQLSATAR